jgi:hypothetical protein
MKLAILILRLYKLTISPALYVLFGKGCRFTPTCSEYAMDVIKKNGVWTGSKLTLTRLLKCNPISSRGYFVTE